MKKSILSLVLILVMLLAALPMGFTATEFSGAGEDLAETGANLNISVTIDKNKCVVVNWNDYPGAATYYLILTNYNPETGYYTQVRSGQVVSALQPCTYTFPQNFSLDKAYGTDDYRVSLYADDSNGKTLASVESETFHIGIPNLETPTITLFADGHAEWSAVPHAASYTLVLYDKKGTAASIVRKAELDSSYTSYDFRDNMVPGISYYAMIFAQADHTAQNLYKNSEMAYSDTVVYSGEEKTAVKNLKWSGNTLSWDAYPKATLYGLWLYKLSGGSYVQQGSALTATAPSYDFNSLFLQYGNGTYRVKVQARRTATQIISLDTDSPTKAFSNIISNFVIGGITEPVDGEAPDGECLIPTDCGYRPTIPNYGYVTWYTDNGDILNPDKDTFKAGEKYSAQVTLVPTEGYEFAETGLTGTMNGKDTTKSIFIARPKKMIYMSRWFTCSAASVGCTVNVTVKSFLDDFGAVKVTLANRSDSTIGFTNTIYGNDNLFIFPEVPSGLYLMTVTKANHVTKTANIAVNGNATGLTVELHPIGDINGDGLVNTTDVMRANIHAKGVLELTGYEFECANVNDDELVNTTDVMRINLHAMNLSSLWK